MLADPEMQGASVWLHTTCRITAGSSLLQAYAGGSNRMYRTFTT
jgi:hypothetical protein